MTVAVHIRDVTKTFENTRAVDRITLDIAPGELFFLLGPSGCGKTTLLRCIAGFYTPDTGSISFDNRDITRLPPHERNTGMVFQSYALWPHMTVGENVAFGLELRGLPKADIRRRVGEALDMVRMGDRADGKPNELSGGQQQRIALARALVIRPLCLLLDEPLSNLDAKLRLEMRAEIRRICKEAGLTAIYVTHDQKEALSIADRLAILESGAIRQCGRPQDVYLRPNSRFVAGFIGETNLVDGVVRNATAGKLVVRTAFGDVTSTALTDESPANGTAVTLSLRPEVIRLGTPPAGTVNVFDGEIHDTNYLGEIAQHQVRLGPSGTEFKVFEMHPKFVARDHVERAQAWVDAADVIVLTR